MHIYINDRPICVPQGKVPGVAEVTAGRACPTGTSLLQLGLAVVNRSQASIFSLKIFLGISGDPVTFHWATETLTMVWLEEPGFGCDAAELHAPKWEHRVCVLRVTCDPGM